MVSHERNLALVEIGSRVRKQRKVMELTQEQLAKAADISKSFLSELESGQTAASGLIYLRIADALDMAVQWLLTGQEPELPESQAIVSVPPVLSDIAEEMGWSHQDTLDIAAGLQGILARRTRSGRKWEATREQIIAIAKALRIRGKR